jgi:hypothetical protein
MMLEWPGVCWMTFRFLVTHGRLLRGPAGPLAHHGGPFPAAPPVSEIRRNGGAAVPGAVGCAGAFTAIDRLFLSVAPRKDAVDPARGMLARFVDPWWRVSGPHVPAWVPFGHVGPLEHGVTRGLAGVWLADDRVTSRFFVHRHDRGTVGQRAFPPGTGFGQDGPWSTPTAALSRRGTSPLASGPSSARSIADMPSPAFSYAAPARTRPQRRAPNVVHTQ